MSYTTIPELFYNSVKNLPDQLAYSERKNGEWVGLTYGEVGKLVETFAAGLYGLGVRRGDKIAILAANNPRWGISDYAITGMGCATVTVYPTLIPSQIQYIIDDSDAKIIISENQEQTDKVLTFFDGSKKLETIICMDDSVEKKNNTIRFQDVLEIGIKSQADGYNFEEEAKLCKPDDLLTLIYTSGTTGNPKGVMLTHNNLVSNVLATHKVIKLDHKDSFLSFLPLSHVFERMGGHFLAFSSNASVYFAENMDSIAENMRDIKPTLMTSVPRLYEKMYIKVLDKVAGDPALRQKIFWWAIGVGKEAAKFLQRGKQPSGMLAFKYGLASKLVFSKIKDRVGGRLRFFVSGGAPLSKEIGEFFAAANIAILEGYGLTETSPVISVNRPELYKFGTVGLVIDGVEVKFADDGEILCKGPNVMKGYYNDQAATDEAIDSEGWFHTGDIGDFDEDNCLRITDRKKNILVTSGGKNIAPAPMEIALGTNKYIDNVLVIGDNQKFISALIVPSFEALDEWAKLNGVSYSDKSELLENQGVKQLYEDNVSSIMTKFAHYEKVKKFELLTEVWSIETGELTPKMSVKRKVVEKNYAELIKNIYAG
ncbi:MAG: long-chain fatty acid--CoA ligase [Candidatus Marinimicrobia bacterium]|nr:long-chain fatty acid--CoA ligase [Candidatus Neomarinimicrobiota bacterium]